jgi:hypothetical protein
MSRTDFMNKVRKVVGCKADSLAVICEPIV